MRMTESEFMALQARIDGSRGQREQQNGAVKVEADLHREIIDECKRRGWLAFHGSMAHKTFRTAGEPDFVILRDGGKTILVECKAKGGKLSVEQSAVKFWAERLGHKVHVVWSFEEFLELL